LPPAEGWKLFAKRRIHSGGKVYDPGAEIPPNVLGANFMAMLDGRFVEWKPPGYTSAVPVRDAVVSEPEPTKPNIPVLVADSDPVAAWRLSITATSEALGINRQRSKDSLLSTHKGQEMYKLAAKVGAAQEAKANRQQFARRVVPADL
jgi:hypothetical protein